MEKGIYDYDFSQFDKLSRFQMEPIDAIQMLELATHIRDTHAIAYTWNARAGIADKELREASVKRSQPAKLRTASVKPLLES